MMSSHTSFFPDNGNETGEPGEPGVLHVSNADFYRAIYTSLPEGAQAAACVKEADPSSGPWVAINAGEFVEHLSGANNNYLNCSSFKLAEDGSLRARKENFVACHFLMLDDIGTKVPLERLNGFDLSWLIETSPNNFQGGIILSEPLEDDGLATQLLEALIAAGLCDKGSKGPLTRWARLPVAINGKAKHVNPDQSAFQCKLTQWQPQKRYTPQEIVEAFDLQVVTAKQRASHPSMTAPNGQPHSSLRGLISSGVLMPKAEENPVVTALKEKGLYKKPIAQSKHDITCPWVEEHTDQLDSGTAYFEPDENFPLGGFCCQHSHRGSYHIHELLDHLNVAVASAQNKPVISIIPGKLHQVVAAAESVLAGTGLHYQFGGQISTIKINPLSGDPSIVCANSESLARELSYSAHWQKYSPRKEEWIACDPSSKHVKNLLNGQVFSQLPVVAGLVRQPYFSEIDGTLIQKPGYEQNSFLFGVFDPNEFPIPEPTPQEAQRQLGILEELISEFHFAKPIDKSATLSAIFTAVVRATIPFAPGFHVRAPAPGSGKTYLCDLISAFAGPGGSAKVSYPTTSEEATKTILSLMLTSPAVIEFDDMDTDWIAHGIIKRMLTSKSITERVLGASQTATVTTRVLLLGSGNNVGPTRDLLRRVMPIHINPKAETPATLRYTNQPVELVRMNRGKYVAAVLCIIEAWKRAGSPKPNATSIATYGGPWSNYCRYPLMWLGLSDPALALIEQIGNDTETEAMKDLFQAWHAAFGSNPTTVRKALDATSISRELADALAEFPIFERGQINRTKLGNLLRRNADRVVGNSTLKKCKADGRAAWQIILGTPASPLSPALLGAAGENVSELPKGEPASKTLENSRV